ncbi:MAG: hypothetical protein ACJ79R_09655 [Anaeromyxobacteraceae bacterium]
MNRREERARGTSRLVALHEDEGAFDRAFWRTIPPAERLAMVWQIVVDELAFRDPDAAEPRLQRSVCRVERRGR